MQIIWVACLLKIRIKIKIRIVIYLEIKDMHTNELSQGLQGLCCSIETKDHIEIITITAVLFE